MEDEFRGLIATLASSRPDVLPAKKRNALIQTVRDTLQENVEARQILAQWQDLRCSSLHAYRRVVPLFTLSLLQQDDDKDIQQGLAKGLTLLLHRASDPNLVESVQNELMSHEEKNQLSSAFLEIARGSSSSERVIPAVAIGYKLDYSQDWLSVLLQHSLLHFSSASELALVRSFLNELTLQDWNETLGPGLQLKLKSHPDKCLETLYGYIQYVVAEIDQEWMNLLLKHLQSPKEENRLKASQILCVWAQRNPGSSLPTIATTLVDAKITLAPARSTLCQTLETIATNITQETELENAVVEQVLNGLANMVSKEPKQQQRLSGQLAVVEWMVVAKRRRASYESALELIRKPISKNTVSEAGQVMDILIQRIHPDLLELIVADLWRDTKFGKGLEAIVDTASNKKACQVEGLLAVYLALLYAAQTDKPVQKFAATVLSAGSSTKENGSFVYAKSMTDAVSSNPAVSTVLPRAMALYMQLASKRPNESLSNIFPKDKISAAARAMASCVICPTSGSAASSKTQHASIAILSSLEMILTCQPQAAEGLVFAVMDQVNASALQFEELVKGQNATREAREADEDFAIKGSGSNNAAHRGFDANVVRRVARLLVPHCRDPQTLARALVVMHAGSSLKSEGHQREALVFNTLHVIKEVLLPLDVDGSLRVALAEEITALGACAYQDADSLKDESKSTTSSDTNGSNYAPISTCLHMATLSLVTSLGGVACNFSPETDDPEDEDLKPYIFASRLCTDDIAPRLSTKMNNTLHQVELLTERDVELFKSPPGVLFRIEEKSSADSKKASGRRMTEDEAWELEMKKELAEKRKKVGSESESSSRILSPEEQRLLGQQDCERQRISALLDGDFMRSLDSIRYLCSSDIEVGNECLPVVAESILTTAVSVCPAFELLRPLSDKSFQALTTLGTCVYEIDEVHAPTLAQALLLSCRKKGKGDLHSVGISKSPESANGISVSALPSPCAPAACAIYEMDHFQDKLSAGSFAFLFPVIHASLTGPRTPTGCEGALRVLERHTDVLAGDEYSPVVASLRKEMVVSVLELLKHDRSQTFQNPTAYDALVACFNTEPGESGERFSLSTSEIAPLLDDRGALGNINCRKASMLALTRIANDHKEMVKGNPLIENRIWVNCFEKDEDVRSHARNAWTAVHGSGPDGSGTLPPPSPLYAAPLLPLLSHSDDSISQAASDAYAYAMAMRPETVNRNIELLCKAYIESSPTSGDSRLPAASGKGPAHVAAVPKKKPISTGLPKKKVPSKKSALSVAGIGKPKTAKKKKSTTHSALLKPKEERTLDREALESQFKTGGSKVKDEEDTPSKVAVRLGIIRAIAAITNSPAKVDMDASTLKQLTSFLMAYGIADSEDTVKGSARDALRDVVASNGGSDEAIAFLLPHLEAVLKTGVADETCLGSLPIEKVPRDVSASDRRKEGVVVALGSVALHLKGNESESKIDNTIDMLISALKTPSEDVQSSVADALTKLMKKGSTQDRVETILSDLMKDCLHGESLAVRRGAAYGLSAAVKGSGIATLKKYEIVKTLEEACTSGSSISKEGSLFAMELLSARLGLLFEPYVIVLLPSLLKSFSDSSDHVRTAASQTAGLIMSKLSAHGVKLVMPAVLTAFDDPAWRTKQASIRMLGSMSHLAPKQLASALPKVVPKLTEAFSDTHPKVKASAQEALNEISTVVKNPEISSISDILLKALTDPADNTTRALESLIETEFLHAIDAPSLALIAPILHRGLRDRGATNKRYGGLIAGNICTMINDPRDFIPYLPLLLPDLQVALLDPIPDVRSTAAKALGSLTRSLGDHILPELRPWLVKKLRDEGCSSAERSGAAQGLTEVLIASGSEVVEDAMRNEILPLRNFPEPSTREGVLWMLTFLPPAMGQGFTPLIDLSLPALISGLSDDSEPVRDVAMRAGRVLIRSHGKVHVDKILPSLEVGLSDEDYRIRVASLSLLGDLLSMIGGTTMIKGDGDTQDDIRKAERAQAQIALVLGSDTRKRVLSGLYLARNDTMHVVRQSAIQVWKTVVSVTARTLRDIMPVLVSKIIDNLASGNEEKTVVAGQCLGDVVSKLGDSVLPQIIPVLRNALYDGDEHTKRGVCVGLSEVIKCSTKDQILRYIEIIVKVVQDALSDDDENVRKMAAASFQSLHNVVGNRAFDEVVPSLMVALENGDSEEKRLRALNGLTGILGVRSRELLPYIIPRLIERPITTYHAKALSGIADVTAGTIYAHFTTIVPALLGDLAEMGSDDEDGREEAIRDACRSICGSVDESGVNILISEIASKCGSDKPSMRRESCRMLECVIVERAEKKDFYEQIPIMLRELLYRLNDDDPSVLKAANGALTDLSKHVPAEELVKHVEFIRNLLASMVSDARRRKGGVGDREFLLPGFNMPKGLDPFLPIYQRGILYGSPTIREVSANGLGEMLSLTSTKYLAGPLLIKMTGPLLRIVGDRNPSNVKVAILKTLGLILVKGGPALRAFVPQFQTTFVKALSDPSRQVRVEAIEALSLLMPLSTRVDPLIKELVSGSLGKNISAEGLAAAAIQTATLEALAAVLQKGGAKAKLPASVPSALDASKELLTAPDDGIREAAAKVMGEACALLGAEVTLELVRGEILGTPNDESTVRHGKACAIRRMLTTDVGAELKTVIPELKKLVTSFLNDDKSAVREAACVAIGTVIGRAPDPKASLQASEGDLVKILNNSKEPMEIHRAVASGLCLALQMIDREKRIVFMGLNLLDTCLKMALSGSQRVQFAYNDVLWLALDVENGQEGLERYANIAVFDNVRSMRSLHSKVLTKIKEVTVVKD